jgi:FAD/FMN-containing dehydrogenase
VPVPGDIDDTAGMSAYRGRHAIQVSARDTCHTVRGQALVHNGLIVDMTALRTVHSVESTGTDGGGRIEVDAGATWSQAVAAAAESDCAFPCLNGYLGVGGP